MKIQLASFATVALATALGTSGCGASNTSSGDPRLDAAVSNLAVGSQGDAAGPTNTDYDSGDHDAERSADASSCDGGPLGPPTTHRAADVACPSTRVPSQPCDADSECADAGGAGLLPK